MNGWRHGEQGNLSIQNGAKNKEGLWLLEHGPLLMPGEPIS